MWLLLTYLYDGFSNRPESKIHLNSGSTRESLGLFGLRINCGSCSSPEIWSFQSDGNAILEKPFGQSLEIGPQPPCASCSICIIVLVYSKTFHEYMAFWTWDGVNPGGAWSAMNMVFLVIKINTRTHVQKSEVPHLLLSLAFCPFRMAWLASIQNVLHWTHWPARSYLCFMAHVCLPPELSLFQDLDFYKINPSTVEREYTLNPF